MTDCCPAMGPVRQHPVFSDNYRNTQCAKSRSVCTFAACWKNCVVSSTQQRQQTEIQLSFYSPKTTNQINNLEQFTLCQNTDLKSFLSFTYQYKQCVFSQTIQTWTHRMTVTNVNENERDRSQVLWHPLCERTPPPGWPKITKSHLRYRGLKLWHSLFRSRNLMMFPNA